MIDETLIARYHALDTPLIADALDELDIPGCLLGIGSVLQNTVICGEAFTVHYVPRGLEAPSVGSYFDEVLPGQIVVIDNAGRTDCAVWGDLTTCLARNRRIGGTVIDGACRDIRAIREQNYPVFCKSVCMISGRRYVQQSVTQVPVSIAGMRVCPGDLIFGDETGVIAIPHSKITEVLEVAERILKDETTAFRHLSYKVEEE